MNSGPFESVFPILCFKALMCNTLVEQINVLAVRRNYSYKVKWNCIGQISLCMPKVLWWQDFRKEIIEFVLISRAQSYLSQGPARVKLWSLHCDLLKAVCGVIKKKYCFIKTHCHAAMAPANADYCWSMSLVGGNFFHLFSDCKGN